jgi:hypothetical protein
VKPLDASSNDSFVALVKEAGTAPPGVCMTIPNLALSDPLTREAEHSPNDRCLSSFWQKTWIGIAPSIAFLASGEWRRTPEALRLKYFKDAPPQKGSTTMMIWSLLCSLELVAPEVSLRPEAAAQLSLPISIAAKREGS